jgi:hypothetical protein
MKKIDFSEVREYYERTRPEGHWFDAKTLKFFGSRLPSIAYETNAGLLFISSELDFNRERRYYNVRRQEVNGDIKTVGTFNSYRTRAEALNAIKELHK